MKSAVNLTGAALAFLICLGGGSSGTGLALAESVVLEWDAPTQNSDGTPLTDLAGYVLRQEDDLGGTVLFNIDAADGESYTVADLAPGGRYVFTVAAVDFSTNQSEWSETLEVVIPAPPTPTPSASPTPDGTPTPDPTETPTPDSTATPTPDETPTAKPTPHPSGRPTASPTPRITPDPQWVVLDFDGDGSSDIASASKAAGQFAVYLSDLEPGDGAVLSGALDASAFGAGPANGGSAPVLITAAPVSGSAPKKKDKPRIPGRRLQWRVVAPSTGAAADWVVFGKASERPLFGCNFEGQAVPAVLHAGGAARSKLLFGDGRRVKLPLRTRQVLCSGSWSSSVYALQGRGQRLAVIGFDAEGSSFMKQLVPAGLKDLRVFAMPAGKFGAEVPGLIAVRDGNQVVVLWDAAADAWQETDLQIEAQAVKGLAVGSQGDEYRWLAVQRESAVEIVAFMDTTEVWTAVAAAVDDQFKLANQALVLAARDGGIGSKRRP